MTELISTTKTTTSLIEALVSAQLLIKAPIKDKLNAFFKSAENPKGAPYCSLDSIYESTRIPLASNGLTITHTTQNLNGWSLLTTLMHVSGESICNTVPLFIDKLTSQGFGSALTYARKYAVCSLLGLPTEEDDDGNLASDTKEKKAAKPEPLPVRKEEDPFANLPMSDDQVESLIGLIGEDSDLFESILNGYKVNSLKAIPTKNFVAIFNNIQARKFKRT